MDNESSSAGHTRRKSTSWFQQLGGEVRPDSQQAAQSPYTQFKTIPETEDLASSGRAHDESEDSPGTSSSEWEMDDIPSDEGLEDDEETGLTEVDKRRRRRRKRRNTRLDERIVSDDAVRTVEAKIASQNVIRAAIINGILIGLWYLFSISISVYNKWMFSKGNLDFHFPLFTTCLHMVVQFALASLVLWAVPSLRPSHGSLDAQNAHYAQISQSPEDDPNTVSRKPVMTKWFYLTRISPCGAATGLDIGLGNTSLKFISLTFYTMCKSSVLAFVLLFAFVFKLEKPSWKLGGIILFMTFGVIMMVAGETAFNAIGFILIMSAAFFSGFRWSLTHILLLRNPATSNPFASIFFLAPVMFASLLIIAIPAEGPSEVVAGFGVLVDAKGLPLAIAILLFPGMLAFLMTASEFALLQRTSVVTLSVCGIFKEVLTISAAALVFHDALTPINISGLLVTIASIAVYNYMKIKGMAEGAKREAHHQVAAEVPVLSAASKRRATLISDGEDSHRVSTSSLIRNNLNMHVDVPKGALMDGNERERSSPIKRPEDLE